MDPPTIRFPIVYIFYISLYHLVFICDVFFYTILYLILTLYNSPHWALLFLALVLEAAATQYYLHIDMAVDELMVSLLPIL